MNVTKKISVLQALFLLIMAVGFSNHVTIIPLLLQVGYRDSWISVICAYLLFNAWILIPYFIAKKTGELSLPEWLTQNFGKWTARLFIWPFALYLLVIAAITLKETTNWVNITYLPQTPKTVVAVTFILLCLFIASSGIRSIAIASGLLLPLVWVFGYFVMTANFPYKDYSKLFPIFTQGVSPILHAMVYAGGGFIEAFILIFIRHHIAKPLRFGSWILLAFILCGLTLGPLMGAIATYGPVESANQRYPAFEQWRLVVIGKYIAHVDFLALYQWLSGAFIRIALALYIILDWVQPNRKAAKRSFLTLLFIILMAIIIAPISDIKYVQLIRGVYYPYALIVILAASSLLAGLVFLKSRTRRRKKS